MAVEARHLNLFHPQLIGGNRELMNPIEGDANLYNSQMGYGVPLVSGTTTTETLLPAYNSVIVDSSVSPKTVAPSAAIKSDSGLTFNYNSNLSLPRKRSRECMNINPFASSYPSPPTSKSCGSFSFLGEDLSLQIYQQQLDIDRLISQHLEKVRSEVEDRRKRQARRIIEAIEVSVMKKLKAKEEEMEKMSKLNLALEERVKTLNIENEVWRDMAQTNEAAVNTLRTNLEQVLRQAKEDRKNGGVGKREALVEDAQSSCGSNEEEEKEEKEEEEEEVEGRWRVVKSKTVKRNNKGSNRKNGGEERGGSSSSSSSKGSNRMCRNCGKEESSVLLLPCRHLCLCTVCGSSVHTCPICKSSKNGSVHVNMC
ncbi:probable BOI-related E3 ubiquitin-protein ligase 3 [Cucurbita pepo subsp. pepo]|uniref:probable BOI-related E3 ubiquitin-protein ligase 3 n=1 Tax=Cucurbita pepo subsp. pepo TaxID=3664 RepID=UPI000C9D7DA7|nr:probable BOI-related E3 ubiquitin-protein ligase 3 [Cucurbita pepo subsp. pepo]